MPPALTPTSLGLLLPVFEPKRRAGAVRIWAATGAVAAAAGPVVGGLLVGVSWRWVFLVNLPVGVLTFVAAERFVPDSRDPSVTRMPDLLGTAVLTISLGLVALGLVEINTWPAVRSAIILVAATLGVAGFWLRSTRHDFPVVEPALLRVRAIAWSNVTTVVFSVAFAANLLAAILWMQDVWHYSALVTGLGIAPGPLMVPVFALAAGKFSTRVSAGRIAALGCLLFSAGAALVLLRVGPMPDYAGGLLPGWIVGGIGVGLALPTIQAVATADLPPDRFATGVGVVSMSRQIGYVLGISLLVALLGTPHSYVVAHRVFVHAWIAIGSLALLAAASSLAMTPRRPSYDPEPTAATTLAMTVAIPELIKGEQS